ncbi:hypothetical protein [Methylobacterium oxalidis]|uniref:Uncharacterized protein n=1 Tax=Methylobacterium oxalidis TaxID=944322 RepID=A0A512J2V6_9HYPH|nr:hypothetical protein [Methylobacterium oxalidis]GEP04297.1 hypothetical protein MOX02_23350 [Methylobacterium oxalidis]GJE32988.1 hypothetical protein LDDCCGHA_3187 [Methylobacterium oxalidis]GLS67184.1 hypothetical protein GCM10007888_55670 [Methylobacterium oxalidis]
MAAVELSVEAGPGTGLQLTVRAGGRTIGLPIDADQAARLGEALLAASVLCGPLCPPLPLGSRITRGRVPAASWRVGAIDRGRRPVLDVRLVSGAELSIMLTPDSAVACGEELAMTGRLALVPEDGPRN